jgi:two-component system, NtrC family, sensor histidine kinase HydH
MCFLKSARLQAALVVILFVGSVVAMLINTFTVLGLPRQERQAQKELREAGARMVRAAYQSGETLGTRPKAKALGKPLRQVSARILQDYPGIEGGFFVEEGEGKFLAYAFPTERPEPNSQGSPLNEPPPKERPYILLQARDSLSRPPGEFILESLKVRQSRVVIFTEAVGSRRPARVAVWLMYRLTGPEYLEDQRRRYLISSLLSLGGIILALFLTWSLMRTLKRQRLQEDRLREELRRTENLAALGKLLADVAHEVRTPLAGIRSTIQLWERLPDATRTPESLAAVVAAVDRLNAIVSRLLLFSRVETGVRQPLHVNELLKETCNLMQAQADSQGVVIERSLADGLPAVSGSANALRQVALNLLANALQALPHGGRVHISSRLDSESGMVEILITDTGPGIPRENQQHIFEPFFTTRPDGTGRGLALCREIVTSHGGRIEYVDRDAPGAAFRVLLPPAA